MHDVKTVLTNAVESGASDVFCIAGMPLCIKVDGNLLHVSEEDLTPDDTKKFIAELYEVSNCGSLKIFESKGEDDFSFAISGVSRFRANVYKQRNSLAVTIRVVSFEMPRAEKMHIPTNVMALSDLTSGLVLVTGPAGSGKSTTLACLIDAINESRQVHIVTLEDPIEYLHKHRKSIVSQREIGIDTESCATAIRSVLRQAPDVILLGEMRDFETMQAAITAAETGHLVISTLHTLGASNAVGRIVDAFPPSQQQQVKLQLSMVLRAVVSQRLIPASAGGVIPAFEVMRVNTAIANMIRDSRYHHMDATIASSVGFGMNTLDASLAELALAGKITRENALKYAVNSDYVQSRFN